MNDELIAKNPCRIERGGVEHHPEQRFATMAGLGELGELGALAAAVPDRYRALVLVAGLGGLRRGELSALRLSDVVWTAPPSRCGASACACRPAR